MQLGRNATYGIPKVQKHISFPEMLDMTPWMHPTSPDLADGVSLVYDLTSVIVHVGKNVSVGHNTAYCRLAPAAGTVWFCNLMPPFLVYFVLTEH